MACRIIRDNNNKVVEVYASNGNISNLWQNLAESTNNDNAYQQYLISRTDEFQKQLSDLRDINNEPLAEEVTSVLNNLGLNKEDDNFKANKKLESKMKNFLETVGVSFRSVSTLKDKNGLPMKGIAKADMISKVVEVVNGKADITTLPEEAGHFFVEILKTRNEKLYNEMYRRISNYAVYDTVVEKYSGLDEYTGKEHKLRDEAIAKLIANEIVEKHLEDERIEKLPTFRRWLAKVMRALKNILGDVFSNPYKAAAYQMLRTDIQEYKDAAEDITSTEYYLQADSANIPPSGQKSKQDNLVNKILDTHRTIKVDPDLTKSWIKENLPGDYKLLRTLMEQDDEGTFARYIIENPDGGVTMITNRTTDEGTRQFIKKVGKIRAQEINKEDKSAHARKHGSKLHGAAQLLVEKMAGEKDSMDVIQTLEEPFKGSHAEISAQAGLNAPLYNNFKMGIKSVLDTIEKTQNTINGKEGTGKAKILTEVRVYDPGRGTGTGTAGTIDLLVIYSDGTLGIFDWKFMTPQYQYTKGFGKQRKLVDNPWSIKMDGWNMQIGAYKSMLNKVHGIRNNQIRQSRIIPAHVEYKVKDHTKGDFTPTDTIEVLDMSRIMDGKETNPFLKQISVGRELKLKEFSGINNLLKGLYTKRDKLFNQMKNARASKESYAQLKSRYLATLDAIQEVTVHENVMHIIHANNDHIVKVAENIHKNDPSEEGYLDYSELLDILEDLRLFENLNQDVVGYLKNVEKTDPERADALRQALADGAADIHTNILLVKSKMYERLMDEASVIGEDITENPLRLGFWSRNATQMDEMEHPIFRAAMHEITNSFNKQKQVTDAIWADIQKKQNALEAWGKRKGRNLSLQQIYTKYLIKDTTVKNPDGTISVKSRSLVPKFTNKFYDEMKMQTKKKNTAWFKKHFKLKDNAKEIYKRNLKLKKIELQYIKDKNVRNEALKQFEKYNNFNVEDAAWTSEHSRWQYLELKNPQDFYSREYKQMNQKGNEALLAFYEMYHKYNKDFQKITGNKNLKPGFIANRRDDLIDSVINNGFNMNTFHDAITAPFLTHEREQTMGVRDEKGLVDQIPLPFMDAITNSKGDIDYSLKSLDLGKSLYALSLGVYNYKYMSEVEAKIMALKDYLVHESQETDTTYFGNIKEDEAGEASLSDVAPETIATFDSFVKYYVYGQRIQDKRNVVAGIDLVKVIPALQSIYSLKTLAFAIVPGIGARAVGGINMYIEGIDGVNYNKEQLRNANKEYIKNYKAVVAFSEFFDPYQSGLSWIKQRDLSMNKLSKYLNLDNAYYPLRAADENMDTMISVAMAQNHGIDKNGVIQRMDDLLLEDPNASSLWDHFLDNFQKNGNIMIPGLTNDSFVDFRRRIKEVAGKIKGEMSDENIVAAQTQLFGRMVLQFRGWMPGLLSERFKGIKYNRILKSLEEGRYIGFIKGANYGKAMLEDEMKFGAIITNTLERASGVVAELLFLKKFTTDPNERARLIDKGTKEGNPDKYWKPRMEAEYIRKTNALKREFEAWKRNNPGAQNATNANEFLRMRQRSVRRTLAELRSIILIYAGMMAMGLGEGDDELRNRSWTTRKLNMILNRIGMELGFMLNPLEFTKFLQGGIPVVGLLTDAMKLVQNSVDETFDTLGIWAESPHDRTPPLYYFTKFVPGAHQLGRVFEFWGKPINI